MMSGKNLLLLLVTLILFTSCVDSTDSNVVVLDSTNFESVIAGNPYVLVEIYAPWCGHCKQLAPQYEQAANILKEQNSPVILAKLDGSQETEKAIVSKLQVRGFPTLIFYNNGASVQYNGQRTAEEIVAWVTKKSGPSTVTLSDAASYDSHISANPNISIVGYFTNGSSEYQAFSQVAGHPNFENFVFAVTSDKDVASHAKLSLNQVSVQRSFDEAASLDVTTASELISFLNKNAFPYLQPAYISWGRLRELEVPIGIFIYNETDDSHTQHVELITAIAKNMSGTFGFASVPAEYLEKATQLGGSGKKLPTIIAVSPLQLNYPLPDETEFTREAIESWARGVSSGSIKPHFKSEPVPETQEGAVFKLVGSTFEEVVLKSGKNVIVEFYAPWCGHCKNLEPVWQQLAEHYAGSENIVVAKLDSTQNDNPAVAVSGYPTIYLFNASGKPVEYNGGRDLDSLISFIDNNVGSTGAKRSDSHEDL